VAMDFTNERLSDGIKQFLADGRHSMCCSATAALSSELQWGTAQVDWTASRA